MVARICHACVAVFQHSMRHCPVSHYCSQLHESDCAGDWVPIFCRTAPPCGCGSRLHIYIGLHVGHDHHTHTQAVILAVPYGQHQMSVSGAAAPHPQGSCWCASPHELAPAAGTHNPPVRMNTRRVDTCCQLCTCAAGTHGYHASHEPMAQHSEELQTFSSPRWPATSSCEMISK